MTIFIFQYRQKDNRYYFTSAKISLPVSCFAARYPSRRIAVSMRGEMGRVLSTLGPKPMPVGGPLMRLTRRASRRLMIIRGNRHHFIGAYKPVEAATPVLRFRPVSITLQTALPSCFDARMIRFSAFLHKGSRRWPWPSSQCLSASCKT
jgi:hypothetical protein